MKTRKVDRVTCEYFGYGSKVRAMVRFYRVDHLACCQLVRRYVVSSQNRLATLSKVANLTCADVAAMPNGWMAFRI